MLIEVHTSSPRRVYPGMTPGRVTLRDYGEGSHQRYVVHFHNTQDGGYYFGTYHQDLKDAVQRYEARCTEYGVAPYPHPVGEAEAPAEQAA